MTLWDFYQTHQAPLIMPLLHISWRGLRIDLPKRQEAIGEYTTREAIKTQELHQVAGLELDPHSPKQLMEWVYGAHGIAPLQRQRVNSAGERVSTPTLDEEAIEELLTRELPVRVKEALSLVLDIRATHKILATYLQAPLDDDNRLRCSYAITGTETGRLSSRETPRGTGTNLQNVPPGVARAMVIPDDGMVFVAADLSQAEARVVAHLARETRLISVFQAGGDIHRRNAAAIFRKSESDVSPTERYLAKRVVHASNYGMGPNKFARVAGIPKAEAQRLLNLYFATYPRIKVWHLDVEATLRKSRTLRTPHGRVRQFLGVWGDELLRQGYAYVPQSTVADTLNDGLIDYETQRPGEILLQIHDSIMVQVPTGEVEAAVAQLRASLTRPITIHEGTCTIPVEIKRGTTWDDMH